MFLKVRDGSKKEIIVCDSSRKSFSFLLEFFFILLKRNIKKSANSRDYLQISGVAERRTFFSGLTQISGEADFVCFAENNVEMHNIL